MAGSLGGDGILARIENTEIASALSKRGLPVVDLSSFGLLPGVPVVTTDNAAVAQMAFEHFAERGLQNFAFCGDDRFPWSRARGEHFARIVMKSGKTCHTFTESGELKDGVELERIASWIRGLPLPVAIFASYDYRGQQVLEACRQAELAVPEQVAVLSADDDEIICQLSPPPLSSIILNARRSGWAGADLLAQMMAGVKVPPQRHTIIPAGVAVRQSTDTLAVDDPRLASILRYIRENACKHLHVDDVLAHFPMARRTLEQQMRQTIGRTPQQEIRRVQLVRARELLRATRLTLAEIAERCGFRHTEYLSVVFKRETGLTPQ